MAQVFASGVALSRVSGLVGPNPFAVVLHWYQGQPAGWTQSQINALGQSVQSHWTTSISPVMSTATVVNTIECADLSDSGDRSNKLLGLSLPGGLTGSLPDLSACVLINYKIDSRYRGGHPRTYLPGGSTAQCVAGDTWLATHVTNVTNAWTAFQGGVKTDLSAAGLALANQCAPRYAYTYTDVPNKHKWMKEKTSFIAPFPILSFTVSNQLRTQRRRLGK